MRGGSQGHLIDRIDLQTVPSLAQSPHPWVMEPRRQAANALLLPDRLASPCCLPLVARAALHMRYLLLLAYSWVPLAETELCIQGQHHKEPPRRNSAAAAIGRILGPYYILHLVRIAALVRSHIVVVLGTPIVPRILPFSKNANTNGQFTATTCDFPSAIPIKSIANESKHSMKEISERLLG